jgi:succinate-acetate transporter protein
MTGPDAPAAMRVVLRPLATPLPLGFLALVLATVTFSAVQLGWVPPTEGRIAGLTAVFATVPLQLLAAVMGFLARDPVAATGRGVLAGTWGIVGLSALTSTPGATSKELGILLVTAGLCMLVPAVSAGAKLVPATVMGLAGVRFAVTGAYHVTASTGWKTTAGWVGLALALLALYAALALELEGSHRRTILPLGRRSPAEPSGEPGVRPQL